GSGTINAVGNSVSNLLQGNSNNNTLDGGGSSDVMIGGGGNDTYFVDSTGDQIVENAGEGNDVVHATVDYTIGANIESVILEGSGTINAVGNSVSNLLQGNSNNNTLDGGGSSDVLVGGGGKDTYFVDSTGDVIIEKEGEGNDVVHATVDYTIGANVESVILEGSSTINAVGNSAGNLLQGNSNNNTLDGGGSSDVMVGGGGNDTYFVDSTGDVIIENAGEGNDVVHATVDYTIGANIESVILEGSGTINAVGNSDSNLLQG